jgi:hypothetical protein
MLNDHRRRWLPRAETGYGVAGSLIDAILVFPGDQRGEVLIELRGDLAAFMRLADGTPPGKVARFAVGNRRSGEVMGSLVAGEGFEPSTFRL